MDFGDPWTGLAAQVMAPVVDHVMGAAGRVTGVLEDVWHGFHGSPTMPNGTNWNPYSHEELQAMLHAGANPGQVGDQAAVMDGWASVAAGTVDDVMVEQQSVPGIWQGVAADNAVTAMAAHVEGGGEVHGHLASVGRALSLASEALSRAQHAMPKPVPVDTITKYGALVGGVGGGIAGMNPVSAGAGAVAGAAASHFAASLFEDRNKGRAVEVMQRFERDLQDALAQITSPAKLPPPNGPIGGPIGDPPLGSGSLGGGGGSGRSSGLGVAGSVTSASTTTGLPPGASSLPGVSGVSTSRGFDPAAGGLGASVPAGGLSSATSAAGSVGGLGGAVAGGVGRGFGGGGSVGGGASWGELTGRGALAGVMPDLLGAGGVGGGGRSGSGVGGRGALVRGGAGGRGMPGMGAGGRGQRGEEDVEHRNKMPQGENLFAPDIDEVVAPPVLGDWANQE